MEILKKKIYEWCDECGQEIKISITGGYCSNCGKYLKPCSMCNMDEVDCSKCKIKGEEENG